MADAKSGGRFASSVDKSAVSFVRHDKVPTDASSTGSTTASHSSNFMSRLKAIPENTKKHMPKMRSVKHSDASQESDAKTQTTAGHVALVGPPGQQRFAMLPDARDAAFDSVSMQKWTENHRSREVAMRTAFQDSVPIAYPWTFGTLGCDNLQLRIDFFHESVSAYSVLNTFINNGSLELRAGIADMDAWFNRCGVTDLARSFQPNAEAMFFNFVPTQMVATDLVCEGLDLSLHADLFTTNPSTKQAQSWGMSPGLQTTGRAAPCIQLDPGTRRHNEHIPLFDADMGHIRKSSFQRWVGITHGDVTKAIRQSPNVRGSNYIVEIPDFNQEDVRSPLDYVALRRWAEIGEETPESRILPSMSGMGATVPVNRGGVQQHAMEAIEAADAGNHAMALETLRLRVAPHMDENSEEKTNLKALKTRMEKQSLQYCDKVFRLRVTVVICGRTIPPKPLY